VTSISHLQRGGGLVPTLFTVILYLKKKIVPNMYGKCSRFQSLKFKHFRTLTFKIKWRSEKSRCELGGRKGINFY
jgi:hypothetical protein